MGVMGNTTTSGGWLSTTEIHSDGLITSDVHTRAPVGRLAEKVPSFDDGSIVILPDGRMRVTYNLRHNVTWQDGVPFTSQDLLFSYTFNSDKGLPTVQRDALDRIESVEAPDANTFVINFKGPFYQGAGLGVRAFWPQPEHLLISAYQKYLQDKNPEGVVNLPYWTSEYVHLGPFRLTSFDPQSGMAFQANDGYFLGKPKVDVVRIQTYTDTNTLFANLLSSTVDLFPDIALSVQQGFELKDRWDSTGQGTVYLKPGLTWFMAPQVRPSVQIEPATLDVNVRAALYGMLDREGLAEGLLNGHRELAAYSLLPPGDQLYASTKDSLRKYAYDPNRAKAMLQDAGWTQGTDGAFHSSADGRVFHTAIWTTPGFERDVAAIADNWRKLGLQVDEAVVPAAQVRNAEYRAGYPGWDLTAQGNADAILGRLLGPPASAATRWVGNRGGYDDPTMRTAIERYQASLTLQDQLQTMKGISDLVAAELPLMPLYFLPEQLGVRKGVAALDDQDGGEEAAQYFGTFTRNAYLWDVQ
jgi:peptide/nickel transport system substrate-binding protein